MSWIVALVSLVFLVIESMVSIVFLLVFLNGVSSLPNGFVGLFLGFTGAALLGLSALSGYLAQKLSGATSLPLWLAGILTILTSLIIFPIYLLVLTIVLALVFGL